MAGLFSDLEKSKNEVMGTKPFVTLHFLVTLPEHQRRGIGAMHLQWGLQKADEMRLPLYLEASPMGKPLYQKMGFEEVCPIPFDARQWGSSVDMAHTCMLRPLPGNICLSD